MAKIVILYGTTEGQAAKISEHIAEIARDHDNEAEAMDINDAPASFSLEEYDAVIVGASIYMGEHEDYVRDFVKQNRKPLERIPSAFFSVSRPPASTPTRPGHRPKGTSRSSWRRRAGTPTWSASSPVRCDTPSTDS